MSSRYPVDETFDDGAPPSHEPIRSLQKIEAALCGAVILTEVFPRVAVRPEEFTLEANRVVWQTLLEMKERGDGIDLVLLLHALERTKRLERAGGWSRVDLLVDDTSCDLMNDYARTIVENARSRKLRALRG